MHEGENEWYLVFFLEIFGNVTGFVLEGSFKIENFDFSWPPPNILRFVLAFAASLHASEA